MMMKEAYRILKAKDLRAGRVNYGLRSATGQNKDLDNIEHEFHRQQARDKILKMNKGELQQIQQSKKKPVSELILTKDQSSQS